MNTHRLIPFLVIIGGLLLGRHEGRVPAQEPAAHDNSATAFEDITLIDVEKGVAVSRQTVITSGDSILAVGQVGDVPIPENTLLIDGRGKFLIPGLVDAHVHLMSENDLPQFLAYGVTTVRNLMGSPRILAWKRAVDQDSLPGPRIVASGPLFAGSDVPWRSKVVPTSPEEARAMVRRQQMEGYDLIKIYDGLAPDLHEAVTKEADRLGMRFTGHIPEDVGLSGVLEAGQDIEHSDKIVFDVWGHALDPSRIDSVAQAIRAAGVTVTPTLASMAQLSLVGSGKFDSLLARPLASRVGAETADFWCSVTSQLKGNRSPGKGDRYNPWTEFQFKLVAGEREAGVPLVAGSDYPNALLPAGAGLLEELFALHEAGLSAGEALAAATITAGRALDDPATGVIRSGARADLVLLDENPLNDLWALTSPDGVMASGKWFPAEQLERLAPARSAPLTCQN